MINFTIEMFALFMGWLAAWAGYLLGATANELSIHIVNHMLGLI